jgi:hypothetical protein
MTLRKAVFTTVSSLLVSLPLHAAEPDPAAAPTTNEAIQRQLLEMQASIKEMQSQHASELGALKQQVADQQALIAALTPSAGPSAADSSAPPVAAIDKPFPTEDPSVAPQPDAGLFPTTDPSVVTPSASGGGSSGLIPSPGLIGGGGAPTGSYLNLSFDAIVIGAASSGELSQLQVGEHDPQQNGFNARNLELALNGAVDPYFEGFANIVFKLDNGNETGVEVEEAFGQTSSLPYGLQLKGGQFFTPFGRSNPTHQHTWDFVDAPLIQGLLLGPDGLRGVGAQLAWVAPTPFYLQAMLAVQNGQGGTGYSFRNGGEDETFYGRPTIERATSSVSDLVFAPRLEASFDLSSTQTILGGVSAAFGPNGTGEDSQTQIYGLDVFYKWKPSNAAGGWPFVKWQSEAMVRRFEAGRGLADAFPVDEVFNDWGAYSQVIWGFHKGWAVGLRGDYVDIEDSAVTDDPQRQSRVRLSSDLTWFPSEFSKLRLQFNHDLLRASTFLPERTENSIFLMYEISFGAHGAHKY